MVCFAWIGRKLDHCLPCSQNKIKDEIETDKPNFLAPLPCFLAVSLSQGPLDIFYIQTHLKVLNFQTLVAKPTGQFDPYFKPTYYLCKLRKRYICEQTKCLMHPVYQYGLQAKNIPSLQQKLQSIYKRKWYFCSEDMRNFHATNIWREKSLTLAQSLLK